MREAEFITSAANPLLKEVRRTLTRGGLTTGGHCVIETFHLLEEAVRSRCRIRTVISSESVRNTAEKLLGENPGASEGVRFVILPDQLLNATAAVVNSQGVIAVVDPPEWTLDQTLGAPVLLLVIDGVQDPGNVGAILRSAEALAASGLLLLKGTVSPFNPKTLRASAGSIFRVPFVHSLEPTAALHFLQRAALDLYAAMPGDNCESSLLRADLTRSCAIVIGSEGQGVSAALRSAAKPISIPTVAVESLNAAVSAAILLYEARRQRSWSS
jgi:TrmH family RNA methyltransferase